MPAQLTKIELKGTKIVETPAATGVAVNANGLDAILATFNNSKEQDNNIFNLDPSASNVAVSMGNITNAKVMVLIPDGTITIRLNGGVTDVEVSQALILFGTDITGVTASNPSATEVRSVRKYFATDAD